ncbi:choline sulfate utilization transcriptional regulator [Marinobacterium rhizophilum]|uniref:LysR family transcriptional regulator n=1 Tax=Marinobacterium rhizophilum TaxID=420402 RepID=A0ABY5HL19_9GAMM|nr:LysR substrate-binding domain-containing protein [Marinobacterium rhizophilum]UTW12998.1 LysR family transcriptional regulator [Marinobacterium rhizophilum]
MPKANFLPPTPSLQAFEAAARLHNFTAAARELDSTQSAISQHISRLEEDLGVQLFQRLHRGVRLTAGGELLFDAVSESLNRLHKGIAAVQQKQAKVIINVATDFALAAFWLVPRLADFRALYPDTEVRVITAQHQITPDQADIDVAINFGDGSEAPGRSVPLFEERVVPVCSPALREHWHQSGQTLTLMPLLQLEADHNARWFNWSRLFRALGITQTPREPELVFNNYTLLLQAAIAGQGVAIGWRPLVDSMLDSGLLIPLLQEPVSSAYGYYLILPRARKLSPIVQHFADWLVTQSGPDTL